VKATLVRLRSDFWFLPETAEEAATLQERSAAGGRAEEGARSRTSRSSLAVSTRLGVVLERIVHRLVAFETLEPIRRWWYRMLIASVLCIGVLCGVSVAQCWLVSHVWGEVARATVAVTLASIVLVGFTRRAARYLLSLIMQVSYVLSAQAEETLLTLFEDPLVLLFVHDVVLTATDEFASHLGMLAMPLHGLLSAVNAAGGVDKGLAKLRQEWPKLMRGLFEAKADDDDDDNSPDAKNTHDMLADIQSHVEKHLGNTGRVIAESAAAVRVQKVYRGLSVRHVKLGEGSGGEGSRSRAERKRQQREGPEHDFAPVMSYLVASVEETAVAAAATLAPNSDRI